MFCGRDFNLMLIHIGGKAIKETTIGCSRHHSFHERTSDSSDFHAELRM
jgi:hypothetical protein